MEDPRNYIEQTQARAKAIEGKELSPQEMAGHFAKSDFNDRVDILDKLDRDMAASGELSIREATQLRQYLGALRGTHHALRKVGR